jgi:hypothetical protein
MNDRDPNEIGPEDLPIGAGRRLQPRG